MSVRYFQIIRSQKHMDTSKNFFFMVCHPEPEAKDPGKITGFFAEFTLSSLPADALWREVEGLRMTFS